MFKFIFVIFFIYTITLGQGRDTQTERYGHDTGIQLLVQTNTVKQAGRQTGIQAWGAESRFGPSQFRLVLSRNWLVPGKSSC